ncbi:hypothetical protein JHK82_055524 [Glycine max]|nr:hypothetical protein JHK82_055524 [Glycine max]
MNHERHNNRDMYSFMGNQTNFISGFGQYPIKEIGRFDVEKFTPRNTPKFSCKPKHLTRKRVGVGEPNQFGALNNSNSHNSATFEIINMQNLKRFAAQLLPSSHSTPAHGVSLHGFGCGKKRNQRRIRDTDAINFRKCLATSKFQFQQLSHKWNCKNWISRLQRKTRAVAVTSPKIVLTEYECYFAWKRVAAVPEDVGTAGAIKAISHHLTAKNILVEYPPPLPLRHAMLCSAPISGTSESVSCGGKDKIKKPGHYDLIGLDPTKQFLVHIATGAEVEKDLRIQKTMLPAVGQIEIRPDLKYDLPMSSF